MIRCLKISLMTMLKGWGVSILGRPLQGARRQNQKSNSLRMTDKEILLSLPHKNRTKKRFSEIWQI